MLKTNKGFTLLELLMVMLVSSIIMSGVISTYMVQQKAYLTQEELTAVQQNLRAGIYMLERDIRMVGFNAEGGGQGLISATSTSIEFTKQEIEIDEDGNKKLSKMFIGYYLFDSLGDGDKELARRHYPTDDTTPDTDRQSVAENIEVLDFVYLDANGNNADVDGNKELDENEMKTVRRVQVTMIGKTERKDLDYADSTVYKNKLDEVILTVQPDHYRRRMISANIECRNLLF